MDRLSASVAVVVLVIVGIPPPRRHRAATRFPACANGWAGNGRIRLRVADIVIEGRANTPEPLLRAAIGVNQGRPDPGIFAGAGSRNGSKRCPWVEHATVERRLPGHRYGVNCRSDVRSRSGKIRENSFWSIVPARSSTNQDVAQFRRLPLIVGRAHLWRRRSFSMR